MFGNLLLATKDSRFHNENNYYGEIKSIFQYFKELSLKQIKLAHKNLSQAKINQQNKYKLTLNNTKTIS